MDATDQRIARAKRTAKKTLLVLLVALALLAAGAFLIHRYTDWSFLMPEPASVSYDFRCDNRDIQHREGDRWTDFTVRGVELDSNQNHASYDEYLRWLTSICDMNANAVRVHALMPPAFYTALCDLNESGRELWLLQGVELPDNVFAGMTDLHTGGMVRLMKQEGRLVTDAVHGNKKTKGYVSDASDYTMAYIVGDHWDSDLVLYTDHVAASIAGKFTGRYASAWNVAFATPTLLSQVFDDLFSYETRKYGEQHIIGFGNAQNTDMLFHDVSWATGLNENIANVNTAHIATTARVKTGVFAALRVDTGVMQNLSFDPAYIEYKDPEGRRNAVRYYLDSLYNAHRIPLLLGGTTMSASRGVSGLDELYGFDRGGVGEDTQGKGLCFVYEQAVDAGFCGGCAGYYLDNPTRTAWNRTLFASHDGQWIDAQDSEQGLGLVALEPGEAPVCTVDGDAAEWAGREAIVSGNGAFMQAVGDEKYLYLRVHIEEYDPKSNVLYIPFDVTPLSGASENSSQNLTFDRDMDFLLTVNGAKRARLTVQEYYAAADALYDPAVYNLFWFVSPPDAHSDEFVEIRQYVREELFPVSGDDVDAVLADAGLLRLGNADPASPDFDALACYCIGDADIEVRIPWGLLNVTNPSQGLIMGDFNTQGNHSMPVDSIYIGLAVYQNGEIAQYPSGAFSLPCYASAAYRERIRPAYFALQDVFERYAK